ncbi:hypothetical protein EC957_005462 [Mortierella hygrophila]|uniref:Homeobox domain-containing protein n=1 Tax=Mortierella hygrophila TaxID=979708 RepID=A0A9P6F0W1_9FUNG|nr:hypothetical protein EC957_005462 [Mortierella hygrophila]
MSIRPPSPPSSSNSASSSPSSKTTTMAMPEAMVAAPTVADIIAPQASVAAESATAAASGPGVVTVPAATSPVVPSKKRQFMTTVTMPVKRTLRSATTTTLPIPTTTTITTAASNPLSSIQSPGPVLSPTVPESPVAKAPPATTAAAAAAASAAVNNRVKGQMDRWVFTEEHVAMLEASFLKNPYVSSADKASFSQIIGCNEDKVRNWFSRRRTKAKLEEASHADQTMEDDDMDEPDQDCPGDEVSLVPMKREPVMHLTAVVIPVISAASRSSPTASLSPSTITPLPISTPAPIPTTLLEPVVTVQEPTVAPVPKQLSSNGPPALSEKLTSTEIMKKMTRILRGNAIIAPSDVETVITLMGSAEDKASRKYIINALMHTSAAPVVTAFVSSRGPQIMRGWFVAAKATPNDQENKEIMLRTIAVWAKLPFNYELLKEFELGKVIKSVSKDKNMGDDVVAKALQLVKHWKRQVMEEIGGSTGEGVSSNSSSSSGSKSEGLSNKRGFQGNGPEGDRARIKRDRDDSAFSQPSEMKLPKFNKGKPAPAAATETKKTHIVAHAGFFKELMAPNKPPPPPPSTNKTLTKSLLVSTGGPSKLPAKPQTADSMASPLKSAPSPPATPTTPTTPVIPTTPTIAASASSVPMSPVVVESPAEAAPVSMPVPVPVSVPEVTAAAVTAPVIVPTPAALQAIAAAVASLTRSNPIPTEAETPATEVPAEPVKPSKPKKVVRFKAADELEMIRYFVPYNDAEEKEALISGDLWRPPPMLLLSGDERGSASTEKTVQEKREAETLSVNYIREAYIPISPAEPDLDPMDITVVATADADVMDSDVPSALPTFETTTDHSAILMSSLAFLTQVASTSGPTATAATTAATLPDTDQSQIGSYGTMYGTAGAVLYGSGSAGGYETGVAGAGYGAGAPGYGTGGAGYGTGAAGYGTGAALFGAGVGSYGTYGAGASGYGAGVSVAQTQQTQPQAYQYQGYQQPQQTSQTAYNPSLATQAYDYQQQYQQATTTAAAATSVAPVATAAGATSNMDPLALIEMLKQVTGHQQQQQQQGQYGFPQNWPNAS